jgi:hypothetical protein
MYNVVEFIKPRSEYSLMILDLSAGKDEVLVNCVQTSLIAFLCTEQNCSTQLLPASSEIDVILLVESSVTQDRIVAHWFSHHLEVN